MSDSPPDDKDDKAAPEERAVAVSQVPRPRIHTYPTVRLDPRDLRPTWPVVFASLEQISDWAVLAFRLGTLALIQACVRDMAEPDARGDLVERLRALTEALAHMPFEA